MKKVAIIAPDALPVPPVRGGGIENGIWEILPHFKKFEIDVLSIYEPEIDKLAQCEQLGQHNIHRFYLPDLKKALIRLRYLSFNFHFPYAYVTANKLNELRPDIVHIRSRLWLLPYFIKLLNYKPKYVLTHHNHYFCDMPEWQVKRYMDMLDAFIGVSNYTTNSEVLTRFPEYERKCFTVHNGCNINQFKPDIAQKTLLRSQLGLPDDSRILLFVGRLQQSKGIDVAIKAFNQIAVRHNNCYFVVVGSSWFSSNDETSYTTTLRSLSAVNKDRIIFTGYVGRDKIASIFAGADIFVGPSRMEEPFGQVFTEAMACGLPILSTRQGGIPEIVRHGVDGHLIDDKEDYVQLAGYMDKLLTEDQLRQKMSMDAITRVKDEFTWEKTAIRSENLYSYLLEG